METKHLPAPPTAVLLSIRAEHIQRIFAGSKHYELRKIVPREKFKRVFLYETSGGGITGCFDVGHIIKKPTDALWKTVGNSATTKERFDRYFAGRKFGYAIQIKNPLKFKSPVTIERVNGNFIHLLPPQSFILLRRGQPLFSLLEHERQLALQRLPPVLHLKPIRKEQRSSYKKLVLQYVGAQYDDIDDTFAASNLRINDLGFDPSGFFTRKKEVLGIYGGKNQCVGFTTLTYKSGGCVKSGPTILFENYRNKGYGAATRRAIEHRVRKANARKIYCTCSDTAEPVIRYLLASGMRIEAHLERHYSGTHNELVFGRLLEADEDTLRENKVPPAIPGELKDPLRFRRALLVQDFRKLFEATWSSPVSRKFAGTIIAQAVENKMKDQHQKPKRLICLNHRGRCILAGVLLPKRGGSVKLLLLRNTRHEPTIRKLLDEVANVARQLNRRKVYALHPISDPSIIAILRRAGFQAEGVIRAPYVPGQDVIVLSKFI